MTLAFPNFVYKVFKGSEMEGADLSHENNFCKVPAKKYPNYVFLVQDLKAFLQETLYGLYYTSLKLDCRLPKTLFYLFQSRILENLAKLSNVLVSMEALQKL